MMRHVMVTEPTSEWEQDCRTSDTRGYSLQIESYLTMNKKQDGEKPIKI